MRKLLYLLFISMASVQFAYSNHVNWTTSPVVISGGAVNASDPQIAVDASGNAIAAWIESNTVKSRTKPVNGTWGTKLTVSAAGASSVRVVSDKNGNATAVWIENGIIKASNKTLNGSWGTTTTLSNTGASSLTLCVDDNGNVVAAWTRNGNIESSLKPFGTGWQARKTINSTAASNPILSTGGTNIIVVWQGTLSGVNTIFSSSRSLSGNWSSATAISEPQHQSAKPFVATDKNGNAIAIWYAYDMIGTNYCNVVVQSSEYTFATTTWDNPVSLSSPGVRNPATLNALVEFDSTGNAIALWNTSFNDETFVLESAVKPVNSLWSAPVDLIDPDLYTYTADLSATSFGEVLGLYMFYNGSSLMIQSVETNINGFLNNFWSLPITISLGTNNAFPKIAAVLADNTVQTAAVWTYNNGTNNQIVASTGTKTLVLPPSNLQVTQSSNNFGVFTEYYNVLSWNASPDPSVIGYAIFRNGQFLEQVNGNVLQYIDNNRAQNASVTYAVTAIDDFQSQSKTVSVAFP